MKRLISFIVSIFFFAAFANGQEIIKHAPDGFDSLRADIAHGKIDTVTYPSKTVGTNRRTIIYTPPGFFKKEKISHVVFIAWHWW